MFIEFGWLAAFRNLHRSGLAVASLSLATVVLVVALILSQGQPGIADQSLRLAFGGDIIVAREALAVEGVSAPEDGPTETHWEMIRRSPDNPGLLSYFLPGLIYEGFPGREDESDISTEQILKIPGVKEVTPYLTIPAEMKVNGQKFWVQVRARNAELDHDFGVAEETVTDGRYLMSDDSGKKTAVMEVNRLLRDSPTDEEYGYHRWNETRAVMAQGAPSIRRYSYPEVGESIQLILPRGEQMVEDNMVELDIVGHVQLETGDISWAFERITPGGMQPTERFDDENPYRTVTEPLYWHLPEIWVTGQTFHELLEITGEGSWSQPTEYVVRVEDYSRVNVIADDLRDRFPNSTVLTVGDVSKISDLLPEPMTAVPMEDINTSYRNPQAAGPLVFTAPEWFQTLLTVIAVALAGLLYLGNLYVITITRSQEMAVLKALGSYNSQLFVAFITEMLVISGIGTLIGYVISMPMLIHQWLSNALSWGTILIRLSQGLLMVAALVFAVSFLAVLLPFVRVARLSPNEVIGNE